MSPRMFRRYYRMFSDTLLNLHNYLINVPQLRQEGNIRIPLDKKIAMTCCYLGSAAPTIQ